MGGPGHKPRGREEVPEWKKKRVSMARLEFGGVEPQLFTCSRHLQPSREETVTNVAAKTEKGQRNIPPPGTNISSLPVRAASLMELDILGSLAQESFTGSSSLWGGHKGLGLWCQ